MKCKSIKTTIGVGLKDFARVEADIAEWLQQNKEIRVISFSQVALGSTTVLTTILYD